MTRENDVYIYLKLITLIKSQYVILFFKVIIVLPGFFKI